jgi:hypothetical protein
MRLIDAEKIDFSAIKDPFDRARAELIIKGCPSVFVPESLLSLLVKEGGDHEKDILR